MQRGVRVAGKNDRASDVCDADPLHICFHAFGWRNTLERVHRAVASGDHQRPDAPPIRLLLDEARGRAARSRRGRDRFHRDREHVVAALHRGRAGGRAHTGRDARSRRRTPPDLPLRPMERLDHAGDQQPARRPELRLVAAQAHATSREPEQDRLRSGYRTPCHLVHSGSGGSAACQLAGTRRLAHGAPRAPVLPDPPARGPVAACLERPAGVRSRAPPAPACGDRLPDTSDRRLRDAGLPRPLARDRIRLPRCAARGCSASTWAWRSRPTTRECRSFRPR